MRELQSRGATRVSRVRFRDNRSTMWSLTQHGTVLNVHAAYRGASALLLDAFATLAIEGGVGSAASRRAARAVGNWPAVADAIRSARERHVTQPGARITNCSATSAQREYIRTLYRYFNLTRFEGRLPEDVPVRLSGRMKSALGHMLPGQRSDGTRYVVEIALNIDLMLPHNGAERADTLLHEMAHVADYLESGGSGHGASWREWARRIGCRPTTLYERPVQYRARRADRVTRVPPLPTGLAGR